MKYQQCLTEMYGLRRFGIILGLDVIRGMLNQLGNPQEQFSTIHVAGTNGKGSIASAMANILYHAGYRVGLYTSPHLVRFNETQSASIMKKFQMMMSLPLTKPLKPLIKAQEKATFFEYTTAMALYAFKKANVDWAVIETGNGRAPGCDQHSPA